MDPLGNNKIMAAILAAGLVFLMIRTLPEVLMHHETPHVPAYIVGELESGEAEVEIELPFPQAEWVSAMDAERGAKVFKNCASCHNVDDGGVNGTGPALWDVVGSSAAHRDDFAYSDAMASADFVWDFDHLDKFLEKPKSYLPGTKMSFLGIRKESDRAAVIEYLRLASNNPLPRPEVAANVELTADAEETAGLPEIIEIEDPTVDPTSDDSDTPADAEVLTPDEIDEVD